MKKVILIGTKHSIQRGKHPDFGSYIKSVVAKHSPLAIAEELDQRAPSVANEIAISCGLPYLIIEPNPEERRKLGISSLNEMENYIFMEFDEADSIEAQKELVKQKENSYRTRELEWLKRLNYLNNWPVLVICGSSHFHPFNTLLKENGFEVITENAKWE